MKNKNNSVVFFHKDLDGLVTYLVLCWFAKTKLSYVATTPRTLKDDYYKWLKNSSSEKINKLYFLDLDTTVLGEEIDKENTFIFDHHKTNIYPFKKASCVIYNETSCAKLLYKTLADSSDTKFTTEQKTLIALADDWDSNTKSTPLSENLNIVYHSMNNKVESFIEDYWKGFKPFDKFKKNTIALYKQHRKEYLQTLSPFFGTVSFDSKDVKVGAVFCDKFVAESCELLLSEKYNAEVAIAVLINQKRIAVRRQINSTVDVSKFVQRIASGGGHEAAAGGTLTEEFIEFTKLLKPLN